MSDGEVQSILPSCKESQIFNFLVPLPSKIVVRAQIPGKGKAWDEAVVREYKCKVRFRMNRAFVR